jgi:hypothetical protein
MAPKKPSQLAIAQFKLEAALKLTKEAIAIVQGIKKPKPAAVKEGEGV